ncbi:transposase [Methylacidiphilum sp. Yel]|uniref:transposase n=1 Tax=Methylacidiphilum sp. Yel TaxID=1847730 RepID=UPI001ABC046D
MNTLKTLTSRLLRKEFADHLKRYYLSKPVFWSRSDCILTVGVCDCPCSSNTSEQQERPE